MREDAQPGRAASSWRDAWHDALYGERGFYVTGRGPAAHFRTASHAAPHTLASAVARLARQERCTRVLEIAAGRGELAAALAATASDLTVTALDLVPRPAGLPGRVAWVQAAAPDGVPAATEGTRTLVLAWEWLDVVPCEVVEVDEDSSARVVLVDPRTGDERLGGEPGPADRAWLERWWPLANSEPGDRAEVGRSRDEVWTALLTRLRDVGTTGALLTVDYDHELTSRPPPGSLSGFRAGRQVPPVPDGSCDLTAHVALDAVRAAGERAGATTVALVRQHEALMDLGVEAFDDARELLDPGGLGGFGWLLQRF